MIQQIFTMNKKLLTVCVLAISICRVDLLYSQSTKPESEWGAYGRDAGGSRYSDLDQVNDKNVTQLKPAWVFHTGELKTYEGTEAISKAAFEATPLMIGGTLYFSTPSCRVFALDAATGNQLWLYDPKVDLHKDYSEITSRGVSAWPAPDANGNNNAQIIFIGTIDGRLIALNAKTGVPIPTFGNKGTVDIQKGVGRGLSITSPAAIIGDKVVIGSSMGDNQRFDDLKGRVRAYNVHTGALSWQWDPIPIDSTDEAWNTWQGQKAHQTGAANAWSIISVDPASDLVFVPTSSPSPDYYGGERQGQNLYGNSLVALEASTGKMVWYFQVVHHDLWDYDIAAQPMLIEIEKEGKKIPAVAIGTKMGHVFILDRATGKSLFPIEERPVPASKIAGEKAWPTQLFPVLPAPLGLQRVTTNEAWGVDDKDKEAAASRISRYKNDGIFSPPSFEGTIMTPGNVGGIHWGGMCYDARQGLLITNINRLAAIIRLLPRDEVKSLEASHKELLRAETGWQSGTPYVVKRDYLFTEENGEFRMQTAPPWGTLLAIDLKSGAKKWERPLGFMMDPRKYPDTENWGSINLGGAIVTAGNLIFVAASLDGHLRAFNSATGEALWQYLLPASAQATPMTYSVKGKQYIVIAAGGHGKVHTRQGDNVIAFALP